MYDKLQEQERARQQRYQQSRPNYYQNNRGGGGYNMTYQRGWQTYISRDPTARTRTTFHVVVDPRNIDAESQSLCINGSPEALGKWDQHTGCPLTMDPANPYIWRGDVELPFLPNEFCATGVFEYKCGMLIKNGHKAEKGRRRRTKQLQRHYFL